MLRTIVCSVFMLFLAPAAQAEVQLGAQSLSNEVVICKSSVVAEELAHRFVSRNRPLIFPGYLKSVLDKKQCFHLVLTDDEVKLLGDPLPEARKAVEASDVTDSHAGPLARVAIVRCATTGKLCRWMTHRSKSFWAVLFGETRRLIAA